MPFEAIAPWRELWVYLSATPLFSLTITLAVYLVWEWVHRRAGLHPLLNPVAWSIATLGALLLGSGLPYPAYFAGAQFIHFLLGPATVALAIPIFHQRRRVAAHAKAVAVALLAGSVTAAGSAVALGAALGLDATMLRTLAPKSVTSPIAMAVSEQMGGIPALAAVFVIVTGILGALFGPLLFALMRVRSSAAKGLALGVVTHGIGTARAMQIDPVAGAFAALGMGLNGVVTAVVLPWLG